MLNSNPNKIKKKKKIKIFKKIENKIESIICNSDIWDCSSNAE